MNLTGQAIQNTYPGLLNLQTATTGITSTLQAIQDGLGNNTGLRIATNQLESDNIGSFIPLKSRFYGTGFVNVAGTQYGAGTQNIILATPFYDNGNYDYSAITINTTNTTSTSDTVQAAIYTSQMINPNGLYPYAPIVSGITANTTSLGNTTFVFPSNISMSGYGAGIYWLVYKISNSGVQPTWRPGAGSQIPAVGQVSQIYGVNLSLTTNTYNGSFRANNAANTLQVFTGTTTFDNPYSSSLPNTQSSSTTVAGNITGFLLHTVGA